MSDEPWPTIRTTARRSPPQRLSGSAVGVLVSEQSLERQRLLADLAQEERAGSGLRLNTHWSASSSAAATTGSDGRSRRLSSVTIR